MKLPKLRMSAESVFCISLFFVFTCWAFASPNGSTQDDYWHMSSIYCSNSGNSPCQVPRFIQTTPCFSMGIANPDITPACVDPSSLSELGPVIKQNNNSYTGGYYSVINRMQWGSLRQFVFSIRLINSIIFLSLLRILLFISYESRNIINAFIGAMIATISPLFIWFVPSINMTSWSFTSTTIIWFSAAIALKEPKSPKRLNAILISIVALAIAVSSKPEAVFYCLLAVGTVYFLVSDSKIKLNLPIAIISISSFLIIFLYLSGYSNGTVIFRGFRENDTGNILSPYYTIRNTAKAVELYAGSFATQIGDSDVNIPATSWLFSAVAISVMAAIGLKNMTRLQSVVTLIYSIFMFGIPLAILNLSSVQVGGFIATRYIWGLLFGFVFCLLLKTKSVHIFLPRASVAIACGAANFAAIGALFAVLRRYTVGASSTSWNLDADKLWWWNTPVTPLTLLGLAFVVQTIFFGSAYKILTRIEETNVPLPLSGPSR